MGKSSDEDLEVERLIPAGGWIVRDEGDGEILVVEKLEDDEDSWYTEIATMGQEQIEIAHLLAAAPDLLAACKYVAGFKSAMTSEQMATLAKRCKAAIAKAKGEAP